MIDHASNAERTMREARLRTRVEFHLRWGSYRKCSGCGARIDGIVSACGPCCGKPVLHNSYSAPRDVRLAEIRLLRAAVST